jgi:hypothetical protein
VILHDGCDLRRGVCDAGVRALATLAGGLRVGSSSTKVPELASFGGCMSRIVKPMARTVKRMVQAGVVSTLCDRTVDDNETRRANPSPLTTNRVKVERLS